MTWIPVNHSKVADFRRRREELGRDRFRLWRRLLVAADRGAGSVGGT